MATLQEYHNTGENDKINLSQTVYGAQTFVAESTYELTSVKLLMYRSVNLNPSNVGIGIRATDGDGKPLLPVLTYELTNGSTLTTDTAGEWREITFSSPIIITQGVKYAITVHPWGGSIGCLKWKTDNTQGFAGGNFELNTNSGADGSWSTQTHDAMFEAWGNLALIGTIAGIAAIGGPLSFDTTGLIGTIAGIAAIGGPLSFDTTGLIGTIAGVAAMSGPLLGVDAIVGTIAATSALSGKILHQNIISSVHTQAFKRLVVAGNNQIWYEDI